MVQVDDNPLGLQVPDVAHSNINFKFWKNPSSQAQNAATMAAALQQGTQQLLQQTIQQTQPAPIITSTTPPASLSSSITPASQIKPSSTENITDTDKNKEVDKIKDVKEVNETGDDKIMGMPKAAFFSILSLVVIGLGTGAFFLFRGKKQAPVVVAQVK